eukprot:COSAG06_NODE_462_length_15394_cov_16.361164_3_plen_67_part_00
MQLPNGPSRSRCDRPASRVISTSVSLFGREAAAYIAPRSPWYQWYHRLRLSFGSPPASHDTMMPDS